MLSIYDNGNKLCNDRKYIPSNQHKIYIMVAYYESNVKLKELSYLTIHMPLKEHQSGNTGAIARSCTATHICQKQQEVHKLF